MAILLIYTLSKIIFWELQYKIFK